MSQDVKKVQIGGINVGWAWIDFDGSTLKINEILIKNKHRGDHWPSTNYETTMTDFDNPEPDEMGYYVCDVYPEVVFLKKARDTWARWNNSTGVTKEMTWERVTMEVNCKPLRKLS